MQLNSHQLRKSKPKIAKKISKTIKKNPIVLILDNVLDTYNIGSFFRLADAIGAEKLCLCGPVVTPPNIKIHRASIGTWKWVNWERYENTLDCLLWYKKQKYTIVAVEQDKNSLDYRKFKSNQPICLVLGSEVNGIQKDILKIVDKTLEIPMFGINHSLNVLVAATVISYHILTYLKA